jgi:(p)ppGpp synthase/HD superfamily hydrolase
MSKLINLATKIGSRAHKGQTRRDGSDYWNHPIGVASELTQNGYDDLYVATALLHDVIEDTSVTAEDLVRQGVPNQVVDAVVAITKLKTDTYEGYLKRVKDNQIARVVKSADIWYNLTDKPSEHQKKKYAKALMFLAQ